MMDNSAVPDSTFHSALPLDPCYAGLSAPYLTPVAPTPLPHPRLVHFNAQLAAELGIDTGDQALIDILSGNRPWPAYAPVASVYAGHQFGNWVSQLGDGRALTIAEIRKLDGGRAELQLKGAGPTPYSRGADGRAVLRSSIREYLCSEAMQALGIPTTRCLSLVASPEPVQRETVETAAVVCRVAPSFVRFGQFEFFYHRGQHAQLAPLADHVIAAHFPHLVGEPDRYARWLEDVVERTARLIAQWQTVGFCHGVMNTDNFSILGLTLDYGPFGLMDAFRQHHVCNHSDYEGRYGYDSQPLIGQWNCSRLLQAALPLLSDNQDEAADIVTGIYERYAPAYSRRPYAAGRTSSGCARCARAIPNWSAACSPSCIAARAISRAASVSCRGCVPTATRRQPACAKRLPSLRPSMPGSRTTARGCAPNRTPTTPRAPPA